MKLIEEGKLNLNQTLAELLPEFPEREQASRIQVKHLISHTSGLQDYTNEFDSKFIAKGQKPGMQEYLKFFSGKELLFEPESNSQYSYSGFLLMAYIAEKRHDLARAYK